MTLYKLTAPGTGISDFHRLANGLRAMQIDFDYAKTRALLDPHWDGYGIPEGHDIIANNVELHEANAVTSRHRDSYLHRIVLDLDRGANVSRPSTGGHKIRLYSGGYSWSSNIQTLNSLLPDCTVDFEVKDLFLNPIRSLVIKTRRDFALIPSSTPGHCHLILGVDMPWMDYATVLAILADLGIIEHGYQQASISKGYSCIRVPWVKKQGKTPGAATFGEHKGAPGAGLRDALG